MLVRSVFLILYLFLSLSTGCSNIRKKVTGPTVPCQELNWYELGRADGVRGLPSTGPKNSVTVCKNFSFQEQQRYASGWYAGVDMFCSSDHGFVYGKTGKAYLDVCPLSKQESFLKAYENGLRVYSYEKSLDLLSKAIRAKKTAVASAPSLEKKAQLSQEIRALEKESSKSRKRVARIEQQMKALSL